MNQKTLVRSSTHTHTHTHTHTRTHARARIFANVRFALTAVCRFCTFARTRIIVWHLTAAGRFCTCARTRIIVHSGSPLLHVCAHIIVWHLTAAGVRAFASLFMAVRRFHKASQVGKYALVAVHVCSRSHHWNSGCRISGTCCIPGNSGCCFLVVAA